MLCDQLSPDTEKCCANCIFIRSDSESRCEAGNFQMMQIIAKQVSENLKSQQIVSTFAHQEWSLLIGLHQSNASSPPREINRPCFFLLSWAPEIVSNLWGQLDHLAQLVVNHFFFLVIFHFTVKAVPDGWLWLYLHVLKAWPLLILTACFHWFIQLVKLHPEPWQQCLNLQVSDSCRGSCMFRAHLVVFALPPDRKLAFTFC